MSKTLTSFPVTGTVSTNYSTITLASSDPNFEVFSLSGDAVSQASSIQCFFQPNATVVINVSGTAVSMKNMGISAWATQPNGKPPTQAYFNGGNIIWNFYEATSLVTSSVTIWVHSWRRGGCAAQLGRNMRDGRGFFSKCIE